MKYKKILLKVSGEAFAASDGRGIDENALERFYEEVLSAKDLGCSIAIVVGGGNFWRERDFRNLKMPRTESDEIGMVATFMNGLVLKSFFNQKGLGAEIFSAKNATGFIAGFSNGLTNKSLNEGKVVIFSGGTGHPFFTTDSAAVLRALELDCDVILKGTKVDGVYDSDPEDNVDAKKFDEISYDDAIKNNLRALDKTAYALAIEKRIPLIVFNIFNKGSLKRLLQGEKIGTLVF